MIPHTVKVAGIKYIVHEVKGINERFNTLGQVNYCKGTIELDSDLCEDKKEQVFVHELVHAIFEAAGYEEQDEDQVNRLGIVLHQVFKDNKFLFWNETSSQ